MRAEEERQVVGVEVVVVVVVVVVIFVFDSFVIFAYVDAAAALVK